MASAFVVVGKTGSGKTTFVKENFTDEIFDKDKLFIHDINDEYGVGRWEGKWPEWLKQMEKRTNSIIIIEEATANMDSRKDFDEIRHKLTLKRHDNNTFVFVFHSLARIPNSIIYLVDGWYIFQTHDNPKLVNQKYAEMPHVLDAYNQVQKKPKYTCMFAEWPE